MSKIIILNAPPHSGKDTIGEKICELTWDVCKLSFKAPMFDIAYAMLGEKGFGMFMEAYEDRNQKEVGQWFLSGKSPREFMIWISETVIKPVFGKEYFGRRVAESASNVSTPYVVMTDGGFADEVLALVNAGHEVKVCRLHRDGFTFAGDSRSYICLNPGWYGVNGYSEHDYILIDGDPDFTAKQIIVEHGLS